MHALAIAVAAPALTRTRASSSRAPFPRTPKRAFAFGPRGGVTCRAGGGDIRDVPPDRRRRAPRSASYENGDWYGYGDDAEYASLDAAWNEREERRWREAYASRVEAKKKRWDAWDAMAEEENARRESAARRRAREKAKTSGRTPEKRRLKLDAYRELSRAADEAYGGKVMRRRAARERGAEDSADPYASMTARTPYAREDVRRREKLSTGAALDWLFTPLTRAARGVDEWLNEDIRVTRGRGYDAEPAPGERRSSRASAYDGRRAFDERRTRDPYGSASMYGGSYETYADDGSEARWRRAPFPAPRGDEGEYFENGERADYGGSRRRGSPYGRANARDVFRGFGDRLSNMPDDARIDAREFERLRNRR